jgi:hypothetical protein
MQIFLTIRHLRSEEAGPHTALGFHVIRMLSCGSAYEIVRVLMNHHVML